MKDSFLKRMFLCLMLCGAFVAAPEALAQNNTNSPYSRYGYGELAQEGSGNTRAMGGVAYGLRAKNQVNYLNPASYTSIDSLTFVFEGGYQAQNTNFVQEGVKRNARNSGLDYFAMQFRFGKWSAMSIGLTPISNVGYGLYQGFTDPVSDDNNYAVTNTGEGGLHQAYVGLAFKLTKNLSIGANGAYVWGDVNHKLVQQYVNNPDALAFERQEYTSVKSYTLDFGLQYSKRISRKGEITLGAVFSPGHNLGNHSRINEYLGNESIGYTKYERDTLLTTGLPTKFGVGLAYVYDNRLTIAADYSLEKWSKAYVLGSKGTQVADRQRVSLGAEYQINPYGNFLEKIKFRAGVYASTPYYLVNGERALKEYGATVGICMPLGSTNSLVHISGQYARSGACSSALITENTLRVNIGITFNERWFFKRVVY